MKLDGWGENICIKNSSDLVNAFRFAHPANILKIIQIHCFSFYSSNLWNYSHEETAKLFRSWATSVKVAWNIPRATHSYFIDHLLHCGYQSIKSMIIKKFVKFFHSLIDSNNYTIRIIAQLSSRDRRSIIGSNLFYIRDISNINPWNNAANNL